MTGGFFVGVSFAPPRPSSFPGVRTTLLRVLTLMSGLGLVAGSPTSPAGAGTFHGTVYQVDTVYNFVDVDETGGRHRFFADSASLVRVGQKRAALIDIAMGEEVHGTYRTGAQGARILMTIKDGN